MVRFTGWKR